MARIFSVLAVLSVLLLAANFVVGLTAGNFNAAAKAKRDAQGRLVEADRQARAGRGGGEEVERAKQAAIDADGEFQRPRAMMTLHMLLGAAAAMVTVLVNSITITYFIGTSRWCKEVCETYQLNAALGEHSMRLKRSTFRYALAGIFAVILVVGLGAAADPSGANWGRSAQFVMPHYVAAMISIVVVLAAFWMQLGRIAENHGVIEQILVEVDRVRAEKGLQVSSISGDG
jgi:hypothetical protein